ncbi:DUF2242 domain-containing protein [uncultured Zoogloea sp.]|uniref:DUF2242 domain-containing protein n=1 Tax=uncultured Zoogloea sp. TaxID=160237 RepID=UPI00262DF0E0|nr:DUF2242 domain-containing protein [uncultured Zoogloea sp.]
MYHRITPLLLILALAACSTFSPKKKDDSYKLEHFTPDSPFEQSFDTGAAASCEAGRRALLSQGYLIDESKPDLVRARKFFQPNRETQIQLTFSLSCLAEGEGSVVFANVRQLREELKAGSASTGLSVAGIGSVSLPFGGNNETLVKVGEETVTDAEFYGRFFALMQSFIR